MYQSDIMTLPQALAGMPCVSLPCGFVDGLPVGLQLIAAPFAEARLLNAAYAYELNRELDGVPEKEIDA